MKRIVVRVAYDGRHFPGWQTQPGGRAIQDHLERALSAIAGHPVATICAGRTDAGVHATTQVVHFDTQSSRPLSAWVRGTNAHLPGAIAVQAAAEVDDAFHARFSARRRRYVYRVYRAAQRHPLWDGRAGWVFQPLDLPAMRAGAQWLVGEHDFSAFRSSECQAASPVRTLSTLQMHERGPVLDIELVANAFLHHMVRNIVGSLVWVGQGRRAPGWMGELLQQRDRRLAAATFAPDGLYLTGVDYALADPGVDSWPSDPCVTSWV